ncbi:hydroxyphenylpyruvate reductase [Tanacetum coccineum]
MNRVTLNMPTKSPFVSLLSTAPSFSPATHLHEPLTTPPMRGVTSPPDPNKVETNFVKGGTCSMNPNKIRGWQFRIRSREHRDDEIIVITDSLYVLSQYAINVLHKPEIICCVKSDTDRKKTLEAFKSDKEPTLYLLFFQAYVFLKITLYIVSETIFCSSAAATLVHNSNLLGLLEAEFRNANDTLTVLGAHEELVVSLPGLEIVSGFSVGLDKVDLGYDEEKGIKVTNRPYVLTDNVYALAIGLRFVTLKGICESDRYVIENEGGPN